MQTIGRLKKTIKENNLISPGDTLIVGASGGPDSQFLIYTLYELKKSLSFDIVLAHLNHLHRKEGAFEDEDLVRETGKKLNLPVFCRRMSMDEYAKSHKLSPEEAGRVLRYDFFDSLCENYPSPKIAVAHNRNDQAETVLMRIIRGTGLEGLAAMTYRDGRLIRPILDFKKSEIISYLEAEEIPYHIDETNLETDYTRNKIRLEVLPLLEDLNPKIIESLTSLADISRESLEILSGLDERLYKDLLVEEGEEEISFSRPCFDKLSNGEKARFFRFAIKKLKGDLKDLSRENIDLFLSADKLATGKSLEKGKLRLFKDYQVYRLSYGKTFEKESAREVVLNPGENLTFNSYKIQTEVLSREEFLKIDKKDCFYFDLDKLTLPLKVRSRRAGDFFTPYGMGRTPYGIGRTPYRMGKKKKLKDFFIDEKISREKRDKIPLFFSGDKLILVGNLRRADFANFTGESQKILIIKVEEV